MKRFFSIVIIFVMLSGLCSCGSEKQTLALETVCWESKSIHTMWGAGLTLFCDSGTLWSYQDAALFLTDGAELYTAENGMYRVAENVAKADIGMGTVFVLKTDGKLYTCRSPLAGEKMQETLPSKNEKMALTFGGVTDVTSFYAGILVLLKDGRLLSTYNTFKATGLKYSEALDGTQYFELASGVKRIFPDGSILKADDTLWGIGVNNGRLGGGEFEDLMIGPNATKYKDYVYITDDVKDVVYTSHDTVATVYALKNDGSVWAWGGNEFGYIGNGTHGDGLIDTLDLVAEPVKILDGIEQLILGPSMMSCYALSKTGTLYAWGDNNIGVLGLPEYYTGSYQLLAGVVSSPTPVLENCVFVSPDNGNTTLAITKDGSLWSWGINYNGQVGNGAENGEAVTAPVKIADDAVYATITSNPCYYIASDGSLWGWGYNPKFEKHESGTDDAYTFYTPVMIDNELFSD